jgi:hypothetical protein
MSADDLVDILGEHKVADLRSRVNATNRLEGVSVPEADASVCSSSS